MARAAPTRPLTPALLRAIRRRFVLDRRGIHGTAHWARVRLNGLMLAAQTGADPRLVELFALLHDSCRESDGRDPLHGRRAAAFVRELRAQGVLVLDDGDTEVLCAACDGHSGGGGHDDPTVATCWDADRLDLWRIGIEPDPAWLCTAVARAPAMIAAARERFEAALRRRGLRSPWDTPPPAAHPIRPAVRRTMIVKNSQTSPLGIAEIAVGPGDARLGLTLCPGKKDPGRGWDRDLDADLAAIRAWGAGTVVTLIEDHEFAPLDVHRLGREVQRRGMDWMHLPIPDVDVPQAAFRDAWPLAGRILRARVAAGERILIHCRGGLGRSGLVAGQLLVEHGCDPRVAIHRVRAARPGAIETSAQERYVMQCAKADEADAFAERVLGSLLAGVLGDAAGYLVEFDDIGAIRHQHGPAGVKLGELFLDPIPASDDTQMTLFTLEGLARAIAAGDDDPEAIESHLREAYLDWYGTQRPTSRKPVGRLAGDRRLHHNRAPGMTCLAALGRGGGRWADLPGGALNDSKGCGTVMRTAPIGWVRHWSPEQAFDLGMRASAITHSHPTGVIAGGTMAAMIRSLVAGESLVAAAAQARELAAAMPGGHETVVAIDAALALDATDTEATPETVETLGGGWIAEEALAIGLYAALRGESMARTLEIAINHSGDSDSTASIAGQLRGAAEGPGGIPYDLLRRVDLLAVVLAVGMSEWAAAVPDVPPA